MEITNKYRNGKIYKITDIGYNKCYIGSTCEQLCHRMARHRAHYKKKLNGKRRHDLSSYDLFNEYGVENCKIELIEYFPCDTVQELRKREGEHIKNTECVNKCVAGRTKQEWREDNRDKIKEQNRKYKEQNRDKINEYKREYRANRYNIKEYPQANIDKILEQLRARYKLKKENKI